MEKIGNMVDAEMQKLMDSAHISRDAAAVLAAVNLADQLTKAQEGAENLRRQVKTYLDEASRARTRRLSCAGSCRTPRTRTTAGDDGAFGPRRGDMRH